MASYTDYQSSQLLNGSFLNTSATDDTSTFSFLTAGRDIPWPMADVRLEQQTFTTTQHNNTPNQFTSNSSTPTTQMIGSNDSTPSTLPYLASIQHPCSFTIQVKPPSDPLHYALPEEPRKPRSDLYLCKNCYDAIDSFVRRDAIIHICINVCDICNGTHKASTTINTTTKDSFESSRGHSSALERATNHPAPTTTRRGRQQRRVSTPRTAAKKDSKFHCQVDGCIRDTNGFGFTRKDNRNVHERTVHGKEAPRSPTGRE